MPPTGGRIPWVCLALVHLICLFGVRYVDYPVAGTLGGHVRGAPEPPRSAAGLGITWVLTGGPWRDSIERFGNALFPRSSP